ncbi:aspartate aminotransferase-like enzyme [Enterococcus lactis]
MYVNKKEMKGNRMYKLLTPGPLTTSETVKKAMLTDHCT